MIPKNNPEKFIKQYGKWWYLREFDYLPEPLEYYENTITLQFMQEAYKGRFDIFSTKEDALEASFQIRKLRNITPYSFDNSILIKHIND